MASLGRSSAMIAAGTLLSRITGLVRSMALVLVLTSKGPAADAFGTATALPNMIFTILSAGLLTAVFVPQIVKAARHDDGGSAFVSRLFTMATTALVVVTGLAMLGAPLLVSMMASEYKPETHAFAVALAYWCIPQVLFFGLFALVGETLNARNVYGPYTWAPIANNVISIIGFGLIWAMFGPLTAVADWTPDRIAMLGGTATGGIIAQFLILLLFWRRAGITLRPSFRWRGVGLGDPIKLAGWTFLMVVVGQVAAVVQTNVANTASEHNAPGLQVWNFTWLVFMLPYSVIVMSIGTPYFTRLSEHAAVGDRAAVRADIVASIRTVGVFIVLATAVVAAAAVPATRLFSGSRQDAVDSAPVLLAFLVSLIPLSVLFIIQRTFYAHDDTRTPFVFTVVQAAIVIAVTLAALLVPVEWRTAAAALGQSFAITVQTVLAVILLRRKIGPLGIREWGGSLLRFVVAAVPAGLVAYGWYRFLGGSGSWMVSDHAGILGQLAAAPAVLLLGAIGGVVYIAVLALLRAPELRTAVDTAVRLVRR